MLHTANLYINSCNEVASWKKAKYALLKYSKSKVYESPTFQLIFEIMEIWKTGLFLFGSIGIVNGFIAALLLIWKKQRNPQDILLGTLILMLCIRIGKSIYLRFTEGLDFLVLQIGLQACIFIGPLFYLFVRAHFNRHKTLSKSDYLILLILLIYIATVGAIYPYRQFPDIWNNYIIYSIYPTWAFFVCLALIQFRPQIVGLFQNVNHQPIENKRVAGVIVGIIFITATYHFALWIKGFTYLWGSLIFTASFYILLYLEVFSTKKTSNKIKTTSVQDNVQLNKIRDVIDSNKLYTNPKLRITDLADRMDLSVHEISRVLNLFYSSGFSQCINEKRIQEAKKLIETRNDLSLEGIGYESGFNSKSTFYATFRKISDITPSAYKNKLIKK